LLGIGKKFAIIVAINAFDIIIGKDLAITFCNPGVLNAVDQTFASKTTESSEFSIPGSLTQVFELHSSPISYEPGAHFILLSLQDKTKAAQLEETRAGFVANASHELRPPLSAILGFIEALQGPASGDADAHIRFLDIMGREVERMNRLIRNLLQLSRVEIDEHVSPVGSVYTVASIRHIFELLRSQAISKCIKLDLIDVEQ
jgi:two-component system phosphate regulon sensor histidine kinase PhoR